MSAERYTVRVTKDYLVFCCGHFITYEGDQCERLHGHNYRAAVEVVGGLDANYYLFDFIALKRHTQAVTDALDHHVLLPTESPLIRVEEVGPSVRARFREREWVFPRGDCVLLPIANTTAELLGKYMGQELLVVLRREHGFEPEVLRVEIEESFGQSASYEWRRDGAV